MNKHFQYREWIFEEESLPADSARKLETHLKQCAECREIAEGWRGVRRMIQDAGQKAPRAGFSGRWKALAEARRKVPSPRPAWVLLGADAVGALISAAALAVQTSGPGLSLAGVVTRDLTAAAGALDRWLNMSSAVGGFLNILSRSIPPAYYLLAVFILSFIGVLGLLAFVRMNGRGTKR
ncbi:MAG: hypothetical protein JW929_07130 [Anaerolineales bacterium]|nr:hypothetical protein [Anaerolineales bacterium]